MIESWGRIPKVTQSSVAVEWPQDRLPETHLLMLPYGQGRSYGDSCLNDQNLLLTTGNLRRLMAFDESTGVLTCEAGCTFDQILQFSVPRGWFLPVTPGTKFVSVAGAIANDVHGKNHHSAGNFGNHVHRFELLRSNGERLLCSMSENRDLFRATVGGLGLTGLITWAEFGLKKIESSRIVQDSTRFQNLKEFFELSEKSEHSHEFSVAWIDCLATGAQLGRGHFLAGNWVKSDGGTGSGPGSGLGSGPGSPAAPGSGSHVIPGGPFDSRDLTVHPTKQLTIPLDFPSFALNSLSIEAFNFAYYWRQLPRFKSSAIHYDPFFYPLDKIHQWNRIYGSRGFYQYQCVVPYENGHEPITDILRAISKAKTGSFLAVLKTFGATPPLGMLSFPRPGVTLALDFPNLGRKTLDLMDRLDEIVRSTSGGAIYPAKDARMSREMFERSFPHLDEFKKHIDPQFSSTFWRRVQK